jgi:MaoC like domain
MTRSRQAKALPVKPTRIFTEADQTEFACFCGDYNPIHMSAVVSRRTISGQPIVHGVHCLMWVLEVFCSHLQVSITKLKVRFIKPIFLHEPVSFSWDQERRIVVTTNEITLAILSVELSDDYVRSAETIPTPRPILLNPVKRTFSECLSLGSRPMEISGNPSLASKLFPHLCFRYGDYTVSEIANLSQIVGMECPGLQSLIASMALVFERSNDSPAYSVETSDERFGLLNLAFKAKSLRGEIGTVFRPEPVSNPSMDVIAPKVYRNEFSQVAALIIGGSRGLGEVVAKIIAAGGGQATITFNSGEIEAKEVQNEIMRWGGNCQIGQLSVSGPKVIFPVTSTFNQIYYFATPKIFGKRSNEYSEALLAEFMKIYVDGFRSICASAYENHKSVSVFYPSTIAINEPIAELEEYIQAKKAGEGLCARLNALAPNSFNVITSRLPRMNTDQTNSIVRADAQDAVDVMLPIVRSMLRNSRDDLKL